MSCKENKYIIVKEKGKKERKSYSCNMLKLQHYSPPERRKKSSPVNQLTTSLMCEEGEECQERCKGSAGETLGFA